MTDLAPTVARLEKLLAEAELEAANAQARLAYCDDIDQRLLAILSLILGVDEGKTTHWEPLMNTLIQRFDEGHSLREMEVALHEALGYLEPIEPLPVLIDGAIERIGRLAERANYLESQLQLARRDW